MQILINMLINQAHVSCITDHVLVIWRIIIWRINEWSQARTNTRQPLAERVYMRMTEIMSATRHCGQSTEINSVEPGPLQSESFKNIIIIELFIEPQIIPKVTHRLSLVPPPTINAIRIVYSAALIPPPPPLLIIPLSNSISTPTLFGLRANLLLIRE